MAVTTWIKRSVARRVALFSALFAVAALTAVGLVVVLIVFHHYPSAIRRDLVLAATLGGATTVACVAVGTLAVVNRLLATSLRNLAAAIREAEKGKWLPTSRTAGLNQRIDEIGELSAAFDRLCQTVTDLSVAVIDGGRELAWTRGELRLKEALALLFELTQTMSVEGDIESVMHAIPRQIAPALGFEEMAILLYDERREEFVVRAAYGLAKEVEGVSFPKNDPISGVVAETGETLVIPDTSRDPRYSHFKGTHLQDGAFACVPMRVQGRVIGAFNVLRPEVASIGEADLRLLTALASYTALAITHLETSLRLRDLSITDELTGVANRRLLMERLAREVERVRRTGKPLAALMIDLDHFKRVNDDLGHIVGDDVLRIVAHAIKDNVRRLDTVARYGGEEFVVLLPDNTRAHAELVAEKLRTAVSAIETKGGRVTISIGLAVFPEDASNEQSLIDAADRALLVAKRGGRNRVVVYDAAAISSPPIGTTPVTSG